MNGNTDQVKIIDKSYLSKKSKPNTIADQALIENTIQKFMLNKEQKRAFSIVAKHSLMEKPEQLKMFLGGMAGTGKSQVIKALTYFFEQRNESYRFLCMAPTGAAASLISGSTYHSVLGISQYTSSESLTAMAEIRENLKLVDYIFLDEINFIL